MYKSLLSDYEASQRALMLENTELKKVLQQMKKEIMHILSSRQSSTKAATGDDSQDQVLFIILCKVDSEDWTVKFCSSPLLSEHSCFDQSFHLNIPFYVL